MIDLIQVTVFLLFRQLFLLQLFFHANDFSVRGFRHLSRARAKAAVTLGSCACAQGGEQIPFLLAGRVSV